MAQVHRWGYGRESAASNASSRSNRIRDEYLIAEGGLAGNGAHSYSEGSTTGGSEEAARFAPAIPLAAAT